MKKQRKALKFWSVYDTQLKIVHETFCRKHYAQIAVADLIRRGFKKGAFEIIPTQEVLPKRKSK
jgi:hypothetical protein